LDLAAEREEALRLERELDRATSRPVKDPAIPITHTGELTGPEEEKYKRAMKSITGATSRSVGQGYTVAFVFVAYPVAGAILGYLIDRFFLSRWIPNSFWATLLFLVAGFYNGIIAMLRISRRINDEQAAERRRKREGRAP
ncbi:MAG TPA: hypothetical protein VEI97_12340, partial [bacterium]|nr:hypothetical protein [bacterium]